MESTGQFATRMVDKICIGKLQAQKKEDAEILRESLQYFIGDVLKMVKNINETSLNGRDRLERVIELEKRFGIPKTNLI